MRATLTTPMRIETVQHGEEGLSAPGQHFLYRTPVERVKPNLADVRVQELEKIGGIANSYER